ncbi:hypothetical protein P9112_009562 [Eukaryota sp. TZLM1-RC]
MKGSPQKPPMNDPEPTFDPRPGVRFMRTTREAVFSRFSGDEDVSSTSTTLVPTLGSALGTMNLSISLSTEIIEQGGGLPKPHMVKDSFFTTDVRTKKLHIVVLTTEDLVIFKEPSSSSLFSMDA